MLTLNPNMNMSASGEKEKNKRGEKEARKLLLGLSMNRPAIAMHHYEGSVAEMARS